MRPPEAFGIILRILGLFMMVYCLWSLFLGIAIYSSSEVADLGMVWSFIIPIVGIPLGLYLLRGAPHVLRFSYPSEK
jgi:hypothetical protein